MILHKFLSQIISKIDHQMWGKFTHIDISLWTIWESGLGCTTEFSHAGEIHLHDMMFLYVFSHKKMILKYKFLSIHFIFPKKKPLCGLIFPPLFIFILIVLKYGSLMNLKLAFRIYFLMMLLCFQTIFSYWSCLFIQIKVMHYWFP